MAFWRGFDVIPKNRFSGLFFRYEKPRRDAGESQPPALFFIRRSDLRVLAFL